MRMGLSRGFPVSEGDVWVSGLDTKVRAKEMAKEVEVPKTRPVLFEIALHPFGDGFEHPLMVISWGVTMLIS